MLPAMILQESSFQGHKNHFYHIINAGLPDVKLWIIDVLANNGIHRAVNNIGRDKGGYLFPDEFSTLSLLNNSGDTLEEVMIYFLILIIIKFSDTRHIHYENLQQIGTLLKALQYIPDN